MDKTTQKITISEEHKNIALELAKTLHDMKLKAVDCYAIVTFLQWLIEKAYGMETVNIDAKKKEGYNDRTKNKLRL